MVESEHVPSLWDTILELAEVEESRWVDFLLEPIGGPVALWDGEGGTGTTDDATDDSTDDSGDDDDDEGTGEDSKDPEVVKAYAKLREAEARERKLQADLNKIQRTGMSEAEKAAAERDDARAEAAALQERLDRIDLEKDVVRIAKGMKFKNPDGAIRFIGAGLSTEKDIREELKGVLKDFPDLAQGGGPPPPVNEGSSNEGSSNSQMNDRIRSAAGRGR